MKLRHAILGLLSYEPQSGYDLSRAFASSVVNFWYADQSQIYRTLDRLEADGAIRQELAALEAIEFDVVDLDTALKAAVLRRGVEGARFELEWIEQIRRDVADDAAKVREAEGRDGEDG